MRLSKFLLKEHSIDRILCYQNQHKNFFTSINEIVYAKYFG